jgi:protein involved in polysaccharide export with SLBB domain
MFNFKSSFLALALVATTIASAQEKTDFKSDLFGQESTSAGSLNTSQTSHKVTITNGGATAADAAGAASAAEAEQRASLNRLPNLKDVPNEFQKFIFENTTQMLPIFGADFFANAPSTFAPIANSPVPADQRLGPGDQLLIRGWGTVDIDYRAVIDRNGTITIPSIGSVVLAGARAGDAENIIRGAVAKFYKGVTISVNFGQLRALTVYVVGQARRPGTYTVSSLSTLVTALFASGGPNANGSLRRVQVKRNGKVAAELDLYNFIAKGDKSNDIKLLDGDTIYIPPASGFVALVGKVNSAAIYELKNDGDTVESLLGVAGGLPVVADPRRAFLERINPDKNRPRTVEEFALDAEGLRRPLRNGDLLNITPITPDFSNAVVLRGNVSQPVRAPYKAGMRVSDLIPNREALISRASLKRLNNVVSTGADEQDYRTAPAGEGAAKRQNGSLNELDNRGDLKLDNRDSKLDNRDSKPDSRDSNSMKRQKSGMMASDGATRRLNDKDENIAAQIGSLIDEINWEYAVVERINRSSLTVELIPFNLGNIFTNPSGPDNIQLQPSDTVTIFSQEDVAVPMDKRRVFVRVEGEVNVPGVYQMHSGDTLQGLLAKAGGPTANAYLFGSAFYREAARKEQQANLEKAADRLESQIRGEQAKMAVNSRIASGTDAAVVESQRQAQLDAARQTLERFRQIKATGRIAFGLDPSDRSFSRLPRLPLENGDRLLVPAKPAFVHVFGAVNVESSPLWHPNTRVKDYLQVAGMTVDADEENVFVMRVDGTVVSSGAKGWLFGSIGGLEVMPGDSIVVPEKMDKETKWTKFVQGTREWAQIFANFGLGAAAIKTLRN